MGRLLRRRGGAAAVRGRRPVRRALGLRAGRGGVGVGTAAVGALLTASVPSLPLAAQQQERPARAGGYGLPQPQRPPRLAAQQTTPTRRLQRRHPWHGATPSAAFRRVSDQERCGPQRSQLSRESHPHLAVVRVALAAGLDEGVVHASGHRRRLPPRCLQRGRLLVGLLRSPVALHR